MYKGTKKINNPEEFEYRRGILLSDKQGAIAVAFSELEGMINITQLAEQYFGRSQSWLSQKINGSMVNDAKKRFSNEEAAELADAFRHLADRLQSHADEIDAAK